MLIGTVAWMGTEKRAGWGECVRKWFFRRGETTTCKRAARGCLFMPQATVTANLHPFHHRPSNSPHQVPCLLTLPFQRSFGRAVSIPLESNLVFGFLYYVTDSQFLPQMLSQRILARRLPQVAARSTIAPRAPFSQIPALRAAEIEDPHQVRQFSTAMAPPFRRAGQWRMLTDMSRMAVIRTLPA
jgi:hypothetical protein